MESLNELSPAITEQGQTLERIKTEYHTAVRVQVKRNIVSVFNAVKEEAKLAGASFYYMWPVGGKGKYVKGGSIGLAMAVARNFQNCAVNVDVEETDQSYLFKGRFVDLETGFTVERLFRQDKGKKIGNKYDDDRAKDMIFQIGQSKCIRNVILAGVPRWMTDQATDLAIEAAANSYTRSDLKEYIDKAVDFFKSKGIDEGRIISMFGKPLEMLNKDDLLYLGGLKTRIDEGEPANSVIPHGEQEEASDSIAVPEVAVNPNAKTGETPKRTADIDNVAIGGDEKPARKPRTKQCRVCKDKFHKDDVVEVDDGLYVCHNCDGKEEEPTKFKCDNCTLEVDSVTAVKGKGNLCGECIQNM